MIRKYRRVNMRYFLIAFLVLCCFSFGLLAQEEEVMEEEISEEETMVESLADQKWKPAEADSIINALTMEEEDLKTQLAELQEKIDALQADVSSSDALIAELEAEKAELEEKLEMISWYKVKSGDYLCKIAESSEIYGYGKYARWQDIYNANKDKINDPNLIQPGTKLFIPRP
jgi:septal ring factor EnvC (AmiA/AmiB activator)